MALAARARRLYWRQIRRYDSELCGSSGHPHAAIRNGCGRPVGVVWRAPSGLWNYIVAGQDQTTYTVRLGAAGGPMMERAEGVGGVLCLSCFDRLAREHGVYLRWVSHPL